jgi:plasmid stabilization system protein ParE
MVYKIIWAPRALEDLRDITAYIREHNPGAAHRFGLKLIERAESLTTLPERGRVIGKFQNPNIREIFLGPYRIAYRLRTDLEQVEIARIWHGARSEESFDL